MPTDNEYLRLIYAQQASNASPVFSNGGVEATLFDPGGGETIWLNGRSRVSIGVNVAKINTSVTIRLTVQLADRGREYPLLASGSETVTLTANGSYLFTWEGSAHSAQVWFLSEVGGTTAEIKVLMRAQ